MQDVIGAIQRAGRGHWLMGHVEMQMTFKTTTQAEIVWASIRKHDCILCDIRRVNVYDTMDSPHEQWTLTLKIPVKYFFQ
jgi:hypothetical protein